MKARDKARLTADTQTYEDYLDINEATKVLGFQHAQYTRRLLHESVDAIEAGEDPKFPWPEDGRPLAVKLSMGNFDKWFINPDAIEGYSPRATGIGQGMSRWILRINPDAHADEEFFTALKEAFGEQGDDNYLLEKQKSSSKSKGKGKGTQDYTASILSALTQPIPSRASQGTPGDNREKGLD